MSGSTKKVGRRLVPAIVLAAALAGCAGLREEMQGVPKPFHDTRLQVALLADDEATLKEDFRMHTSPSLVERGIAAFLLTFSVGTETAFLPLWTAMKYSTDWGSPQPGKITE